MAEESVNTSVISGVTNNIYKVPDSVAIESAGSDPKLLWCCTFFCNSFLCFYYLKLKILKVSKFQKQIFLFSFEAKNEWNSFLNSALASKMSQIKNKSTLFYQLGGI